MDRKLRQTKIKYQNDIAPEWSPSNNPPWNAQSRYDGNLCSKAQRNKKLQNPFACLDTANADSMQLTELFHGFQTIRSLEKDVFITHLATPNFATYAQNMMNNETKTTTDELRLVKEYLEKTTTDELRLVKEYLEKLLLNGEGKCRRGSTNTRAGKLPEKVAKHQEEAIAIPPQLCTCVSKDRLPKLKIVKDRRTSLGELFQNVKNAEEKPEPISNITNTKNDKFSVNSRIKILKEKTIHPSNTAVSVGTIESPLVSAKLHKILHMLQRVYPESSAILKKSQNMWKYVTNRNFPYEEAHRKRNQVLSEDVIVDFPDKPISSISADHTRRKASRSIYREEDDTKWNRECWIKSDAEFLILEL